MSARGGRSPLSAKPIGRRSTPSCGGAVIRPRTRRTLVQGFFEHLFAQNALRRADQEKGRLRTFLLSSLQNYMMDQHGRAQRAEARRRPDDHFAGSTDRRSRGGISGEHSPGRRALLRLSHGRPAITRRAWQQMQKNLEAEGKGEWLRELQTVRRRRGGGAAESAGSGGPARRAGRNSAHVAFAPASSLSRDLARRGRQHRLRSGERRSGTAVSASTAGRLSHGSLGAPNVWPTKSQRRIRGEDADDRASALVRRAATR